MVIRVTTNCASIIARLRVHNLEKASEEHPPGNYGVNRCSFNETSLSSLHLFHSTQLILEVGGVEIVRVVQASFDFLV